MKFELRMGAVKINEQAIFQGLNLEVASGEIVSILGPSGCGKTTMLRACCGLTRLTEGECWLGERRLEDAALLPEITLLFQQPVLYPHLNVAQNIALAAPKAWKKAETQRRVKTVLTSIGLDDFDQRSVTSLSGGEAQRVAFGRALLQEPQVMLLDEPFASVDVARRLELARMTRTHLKERGITTLHVTHDEAEAAILADRVLHWSTLQPGHILEEE
jgi:ABC-type sugar transport system ATPase subunit